MRKRTDIDLDRAGGEIEHLSREVMERAPREAAELLASRSDATIAGVLGHINPSPAQEILAQFPETRRLSIRASAPAEIAQRWSVGQAYPEESIGRLMDPPIAVFPPETSIAAVIEHLRDLVKRAFVTYVFVTDRENRLVGVVAMRELLLGSREQRLDEVMIREPFSLRPELTLTEAMRQVLNRHYPVYPVVDAGGRLIGLVRGQTLFEAQAIEISAQAGEMVGVVKEERLATPWPRSLRMRHPWLQLNLLTAFLAAAVVGLFEETIDRMVILAVFLPVLSGQSTNTGCQALAVALRSLTLGELQPGRERHLLMKEALLGLLNGSLVGVTSGLAMFVFASIQGNAQAQMLGLIVAFSMVGACLVTGTAGALIPLILRRFGADPATASSIFLTTVSEVASFGMFLGLATWLVA